MIVQIDGFRRDEPDLPTRPEMIRRILQSWLDANEARSPET